MNIRDLVKITDKSHERFNEKFEIKKFHYRSNIIEITNIKEEQMFVNIDQIKILKQHNY